MENNLNVCTRREEGFGDWKELSSEELHDVAAHQILSR